MRPGLAERLFGTNLKTVRAASGSRYLAPAGATSVPTALRGVVTGVVGLDTQPLRSPVARRARNAQADGQPTSAYGSVSGSPAGCAQGRASGGFTPEPVPDRLRPDPAPQRGAQGSRRARRADRGRRVQDLRPPDVRAMLRRRDSAPACLRRRREPPAGARPRGHARPRGADRRRAPSGRHRRVRDHRRRGRLAAGVRRAAGERRVQAAGDLRVARPVRAGRSGAHWGSPASTPPRPSSSSPRPAGISVLAASGDSGLGRLHRERRHARWTS